MASLESQMQLRPRKLTKSGEKSDPLLLKSSSAGDINRLVEVQSVEVQTEKLEIPIVAMEDFEVVDINDKLNLLMAAVNKINTNFHIKIEENQREVTAEISAIKKIQEEQQARLDDCEHNVAKNNKLLGRIEALEHANSSLVDDVALLKGLTQVQDKQITANKNKIVDLTARSMSNNILISGLDADVEDENCVEKVIEFCKNKLQLEPGAQDILIAHRIGQKTDARLRPMVVRCHPQFRSKALKASYLLKDIKNSVGGYYSIKTQLPELLLTQKIEREDKLRQIRKKNAATPEEQKDTHTKAFIKNGQLYINDQVHKTYVQPPTVADLFNVTKEEQGKMNKISFCHSAATRERNSAFQGHALRVKNSTEVKLAYKQMRQLYPEANHIMMAYFAKGFSGYQDHGEYGADRRLEQVLLNSHRANVALFVTRDYGGTHLGQRRFLLIDKVAKEALCLLDEDI